jgi:D-3-phosphoglycerate dehydrogenase
VIVTPHVAYYSEDSLVDLGRLAAENVASVLAGEKPAAIVNPEVLAHERWQGLASAS